MTDYVFNLKTNEVKFAKRLHRVNRKLKWYLKLHKKVMIESFDTFGGEAIFNTYGGHMKLIVEFKYNDLIKDDELYAISKKNAEKFIAEHPEYFV